jgi:hypothetical protein
MTSLSPMLPFYPSSPHLLHLPPRPKLLVVDADGATQRQLQWALDQDFAILLAGDRQRALALLRAKQPSIVTLNLSLPPRPTDMAPPKTVLPSSSVRILNSVAASIRRSARGPEVCRQLQDT